MRFILCILTTFCAFSAKAAEGKEVMAGQVYDESLDREIANRAQARTYLGGVDEEDIQVQTVLPTPKRKLGPTAEIEAKPQSQQPQEQGF